MNDGLLVGIVLAGILVVVSLIGWIILWCMDNNSRKKHLCPVCLEDIDVCKALGGHDR